MAFDWANYLTLAKELGKRSEEEAQRTAVSRAYYAAFGKARQLLRREGTTFPPTGIHEFVWSHFQNDADPVRQQIGLTGDRLKRVRRNADYDSTFNNLAAVLQSTLLQAEKIIKSLNQL